MNFEYTYLPVQYSSNHKKFVIVKLLCALESKVYVLCSVLKKLELI